MKKIESFHPSVHRSNLFNGRSWKCNWISIPSSSPYICRIWCHFFYFKEKNTERENNMYAKTFWLYFHVINTVSLANYMIYKWSEMWSKTTPSSRCERVSNFKSSQNDWVRLNVLFPVLIIDNFNIFSRSVYLMSEALYCGTIYDKCQSSNATFFISSTLFSLFIRPKWT